MSRRSPHITVMPGKLDNFTTNGFILPIPMKRSIPVAGYALVTLALLISFLIDLSNTMQGGSVDLRNRITGVRLLTHGIDCYRFIWHAGTPSEYCDLRNNPHLPVSKTTVTPTLLMLYWPVASVPYRVTQFGWLFAQWMFVLGTAALWMRASTTVLSRWLVIVFITAFTYTQAWRWEAERGQSYMLLAFLFACWLTLMLNSQRSREFLAGFIAGILIPLRLPFILLLPFIAVHRRGQLLGAATGLLLGVGLPLLMNPSSWSYYFSAMQTQSDLYRQGTGNPPKGPQTFPEIIEGTPTAILGHLFPFSYADSSVHAILHHFGFGPQPALPVLLALVIPFLIWLAWSRGKPIESLLPGLAAWFFLADFFLPAIRYSYYDILILNVVLIGIVTTGRFPLAAWPCALALPLSCAVYFLPHPPIQMLYLVTFLFTLGALLSLRACGIVNSRQIPK